MVGAVPSDSQAQSQRLYGAWFSTLVELDSSPARFGELRRIWTLPLPPQSHPRSMVADGTGRYLLWPLATDLFVFDTASGELASYSLADGLVELEILGSNEEGDEWVIASRAVAGGSSRIVIFDARTRTSRANTLPGLCYAGFSYARTARMVFSLRRPSCGFAPPETGWVDSLDLADGRVRERIFDITYGYGQAIATNAVGTRLWVGTLTGGFAAPAGYGVFEVATGALLANFGIRRIAGNQHRAEFHIGFVRLHEGDPLAVGTPDRLTVRYRTVSGALRQWNLSVVVQITHVEISLLGEHIAFAIR